MHEWLWYRPAHNHRSKMLNTCSQQQSYQQSNRTTQSHHNHLTDCMVYIYDTHAHIQLNWKVTE